MSHLHAAAATVGVLLLAVVLLVGVLLLLAVVLPWTVDRRPPGTIDGKAAQEELLGVSTHSTSPHRGPVRSLGSGRRRGRR